MKYYLFVCTFLLFKIFVSQDTLIFKESVHSLIERSLGVTIERDGKHYLNGTVISQEKYESRLLFLDTLDIMTINTPSKIYIDDILREEGRFYYVIRVGFYKRYYPNGIREMEGELDENSFKIGTWKYYNENGDLKKVKDYKKGKWYRQIYLLKN